MRGRVWWGALHPFGSADCLLAVACRSMPAGPIIIIIGKNRLHQFATGLVGVRHPMASRTFRCVAI